LFEDGSDWPKSEVLEMRREQARNKDLMTPQNGKPVREGELGATRAASLKFGGEMMVAVTQSCAETKTSVKAKVATDAEFRAGSSSGS
jgi:hypothetical protein